MWATLYKLSDTPLWHMRGIYAVHLNCHYTTSCYSKKHLWIIASGVFHFKVMVSFACLCVAYSPALWGHKGWLCNTPKFQLWFVQSTFFYDADHRQEELLAQICPGGASAWHSRRVPAAFSFICEPHCTRHYCWLVIWLYTNELLWVLTLWLHKNSMMLTDTILHCIATSDVLLVTKLHPRRAFSADRSNTELKYTQSPTIAFEFHVVSIISPMMMAWSEHRVLKDLYIDIHHF